MKKIFLIFSLFIFSQSTFATHLMGGEITWKCLKNGPDVGKYIFTMKVYRDCSGTTVGTFTQNIQVWNHPTIIIFQLNLFCLKMFHHNVIP